MRLGGRQTTLGVDGRYPAIFNVSAAAVVASFSATVSPIIAVRVDRLGEDDDLNMRLTSLMTTGRQRQQTCELESRYM